MNPSGSPYMSLLPMADPPTHLSTRLLFSADSFLKLINVDIRDLGVYGGRATVKQTILLRANDMFDRIHRSYRLLTLNYRGLQESKPPATEEAIHKSRARWLAARELLAEATMAAKYFNSMLPDLERSRKCMDLMTMKVPDHSAPIDSPSEEMRRLAGIQRTYHSRVPAILRAMPDSPSLDTVLANYISNLGLADRPNA